jgi:2-phosphosulfolactate phosphatase
MGSSGLACIGAAADDGTGAEPIGARSHEAEAAAAAFERMRGNIRDALAASRSGRELIDLGYPDDVEIATELDVEEAVPLLDGNAFTLARS